MIGLLGGTFDPIHRGHLDVARAAREALGLSAIWVVPARLPPHREQPAASAPHRFAMAALAIQGLPAVRLSDLEMETAGPSYTTETLDRLAARGVPLDAVCFITGADAFLEIRSWKGFPSILDRCHFAVVSRPGVPVAGLASALPDLAARMCPASSRPPQRPAILLVDAATSPVSSTDVRRARAAGRPLDDFVPAPVAAYIAQHDLYAPQDREPAGGKDTA